MAALKKIFGFGVKFSGSLSSISNHQSKFLKQNVNISQGIWINSQIRCITYYPIARNMQYISNDSNLKIKVDPKTMKLNKTINKPLCYMFTWLNAKNDYITKYAEIYLEKGFDIFNVKCTPFQVLVPTLGTHPVAKNFLKFMEQNSPSYDPIVFQGFSIASYMWGEICRFASEDPNRYQPLIDRIICQTWDSMPDLRDFAVGISKGQYPHNMVLQKLLHFYSNVHLKVFYYPATRHYLLSSKHIHDNLIKAPALFLVSKTDPVGTYKSNMGFKTSWENKGIQCSWKCWDNSPHVKHILAHPEEYVSTVNAHLKKHVPMLRDL